jgi:hypothetical protein
MAAAAQILTVEVRLMRITITIALALFSATAAQGHPPQSTPFRAVR